MPANRNPQRLNASTEIRFDDPAPVPVGNIGAALNALHETIHKLGDEVRDLVNHIEPVLLPEQSAAQGSTNPQAVRVPLSSVANQLEVATDVVTHIRQLLQAARQRIDL